MHQNSNKILNFTKLPRSTPVVQWLSYSSLDPRFVGSNSVGLYGFLQSVKILSMTFFGREVKPSVPCHSLRHVKEPQAEIRASEQNLSIFPRSTSEETQTTYDV